MEEATSLDAWLCPLVPLRIREVEYADPTLTIIGDGWRRWSATGRGGVEIGA